jgi:S-formylglutathione hydrolase FrmB
LEELSIDSEAVGETLPTEVIVPEGADDEGRPILLFLHGRGEGGEDHVLNEEMYEALADLGEHAPIVVSPSGGDHSYWHDRAGGDWEAYVVDEVVPEVAERFGADDQRVAIGGISMGGFGALDIARLNPGRFCAAGGHSPALWRQGADSAPGAFDDEADFERHDVLEAAATAPDPYLRQPIWVDAGDRDPFRDTTEEFGSSLRAAGADVTVRVWPGGHDGEYWRGHYPDYLRFYANALARCDR